MTTKPQIIVIKRTGGHGGHHGGAWKVAYADFVTAMMALFIVLWLMNSSKQIQEAVGGYFKDPSGTAKMVGTDKTGSGENLPLRKQDMAKLKEQLQAAIRQISDFDKLKAHIEMTVTAEGLRIELLESETGLFFESGNSNPTNSAREVLTVLAPELGKIPNRISIEGHTDSLPFSAGANYSNWELSADRANACRRLMQQNGLRDDQVAEVRGFADQNLRNKADPTDAGNRRITVLVKYVQKDISDQSAPTEGTAQAESGKAEQPEPPTANH
ncbi:MAG: flagellar motor protein MotB [Acidobacteriota bacterium]|nr:flagellar motor protein MotB [Acidobacteriota bacterium]